MKPNRHSFGLDFSDKNAPDHPDYASVYTTQAAHLERNYSERHRPQTLHGRLTRDLSAQAELFQPKSFGNTIHLWLINEGGKQVFFGVWILLHLLVATFGFLNYQLRGDLTNARRIFGTPYVVARTAALVLHIDVIFILLPVCRNFISLLRRTPLNHIIPFDKNITFHKAIGWSILTWSTIHIIAHLINFTTLASELASAESTNRRFVEFLALNFTTGPGLTGWIMTANLFTIAFFSTERQRTRRYDWFWYTHHLFFVFFVNWQLHGMFCMIKPDLPPYCSWENAAEFWKYWLIGGGVWVYERILREFRSRHITYISKVIQHPSNVMELQIKKEKTFTRAGQHIFLSCPAVSYFQWHPFTLTSAPEEDYLSVHIRIVGDFTRALAKSVGCDFCEGPARQPDGRQPTFKDKLRINPILPRVMVDGPFGSASEDFMNYETVLLMGAGVGVTPFASILKSMWYRMNRFKYSTPIRLSKVYFIWVIRDYSQVEWFHSLLQAIEEQDVQSKIEISIYLTGEVEADDINNIMVLDMDGENDAIASLRAPTHFGRPNWGKVFENVAVKHPDADVGLFFCGPQAVSKELHRTSVEHSNPAAGGTRFFYKKENF
ncbi:hypothetical protein E1B28_006306 [Marasmius oreades]|uniref:FAD-binding FR-type domain-containing protein n=1 Tax=Marasmius oreades TaxID=181124 RepID=A0A9P7S5F8_9AGAR|nr:uncharacterized protein E1B28_006306 [Marasmius oreades]KAG7095573.1 hypothetical protein E1B28_006306 [Marasmius oreades]